MNDLNTLAAQHHVWIVETDVSKADFSLLQGILSPEERDRADRFRFKKDQTVYTVVHGALRLLLEHYLSQPASTFRFTLNPFGKPSLHEGGMEFNLSHSGKIGLCSFSVDSPVGVDAELKRDDVNIEELAQQYFSPAEVDALLETPKKNRLDAFYRCWTRKEAFVKAHGEGLSIPLDSFSVPLNSDEPETVESGLMIDQCTVHPIDIGIQGYESALAYFGKIKAVAVLSWNCWFEERKKTH